MPYERVTRYDSGHWRSTEQNRQDRQQQARDRRNEKDVPGAGHLIRNNLGFKARTEVTQLDPAACEMAGNLFGSGLAESDFLSVDPAALTAPRQPDGSLPRIPLMRPAPAGKIIDRGVPLGLPFTGRAPDPGAYEAADPKAAP